MEIRTMRLMKLSLATAVVLLVAACGSAGAAGGQQGAAATAAPTATAAAASDAPPAVLAIPASLQGTWTSSVVGTTASSGAWTLRVSKDDIELKNPNASESEYFSINPRSASDAGFDMYADPDCQGAAYTWHLDGAQLVFATAEDPCIDRKATLTAGPWTKAP
jgi:hypothetical protein